MLVALFSRLVGPEGRVVGIEHVQELVDWSRSNVQKDGLVLAANASHVDSSGMCTGISVSHAADYMR